ncbi:MAG: DegT/DnrJ/EryC1/StrS family aminotransferase, partial [Nitrospirae bacterium]|nr:DegT/DnrJ/EryC1/StrS family aminotransferase [Nitrospirota bacterium]
MRIPMVDLRTQFLDIEPEIKEKLNEIIESTRFILGPNLDALEKEIASYHGVKYGVGLASGTDALHLSLRALGIGQGDEVITTTFTFIATAEVISYIGARPVFVDIDPSTFNIDPLKIEG